MAIARFTVTVYTRHSSSCPRRQDAYWRRCRCPKWLYMNQDGTRSQRTAKTRSWDRADEIRRKLEREFELLALQHPGANGKQPAPSTLQKLDGREGPITLAYAIEKFLAAKKNENLAEATMAKLSGIFEKQMLAWATREGIRNLDHIGVAELERFRESWKDAPLARKKKQERVIGFFYYAIRLGWITNNPAALLGRIKVRHKPTDYFPKQEFETIMKATFAYRPKAWHTEPRDQAKRARTLRGLRRRRGTDSASARRARKVRSP